LTKVRNILASALIVTGLLLPPSVQAQPAGFITDKDVEVAVRAFSFVYGMPKGEIAIEIVYDPNNPVSLGEASQLKKIIGDGDEFANRQVRAKMVALSQMGSTKSKIAYVTHGLEQQYDVLLQKARENKMLTFSTDFQCVDNQKCVMGVQADPTIKIEISRAATAASDLQFSQALKLMVREVE
jgi:hypothetical protein